MNNEVKRSDKEQVKAVYPNAHSEYVNCGMASSFWLILDGPIEYGRAYCGAMSDARAWADAVRRLPSPIQPSETERNWKKVARRAAELEEGCSSVAAASYLPDGVMWGKCEVCGKQTFWDKLHGRGWLHQVEPCGFPAKVQPSETEGAEQAFNLWFANRFPVIDSLTVANEGSYSHGMSKRDAVYAKEGCKESWYGSQESIWQALGITPAETGGKSIVECVAEMKRERDEFIASLQIIAAIEPESCQRCEGNGRLWADGRAHYPSENVGQVACPSCGGEGRIVLDLGSVQEIALEAVMHSRKQESNG